MALSARLRSPEPDTRADGGRHRRQMILDVVDLLASAATGPTLIAIENLTDVDDLSLEILARLARRLPELPMIVVGTYRSDELYPRVPMREWRTRLLTGRFADVIQLSRLSLADTATMAGLILGRDEPPSSDMIEALYERTDGNPLHVEELLAVVLDRHRSDRDAVRAADVPDTLDEAILRRIDDLSEAAQALIRVASVIGHDLGIETLAGVAGETVDLVWPSFHELTGRFFLVPAAAPDQFEFRHALIREAVYRTVPLPDRPRLHSRVANLLAERGDSSDALMSHHYELAGRRDEAFRSSLVGAEAAAAISSHREAFELYRRALRNLPPDLPALEHADVLAAVGAEAAASDDNVTASDAFAEARERYLAIGAVREAAALLGPIVATRHLLGDSLESRVELLQQGLSELEGAPRGPATDRVRGRLLASLGATLLYDLRIPESMDHAERARRLATDLDDTRTELYAATTVANALLFSGRAVEGWDLGSATIRRSRAAQLEVEASWAYRILRWSATRGRRLRTRRAHVPGGHRIHRTGRTLERPPLHVSPPRPGPLGRGPVGRRLAPGRAGSRRRSARHHYPDHGVVRAGLHRAGSRELGAGTAIAGGSLELGEPMGEILRTSLAVWGLAEANLLSGDPSAAMTWAERGVADSERVGDAALLFPFLVTGTRALLAARGILRREALGRPARVQAPPHGDRRNIAGDQSWPRTRPCSRGIERPGAYRAGDVDSRGCRIRQSRVWGGPGRALGTWPPC